MRWAYQWLSWLNGLNADFVSGDLVMDTNQNIKLQGTGKLKRGTRVRHIPATAGKQISGTAMTYDNDGGVHVTASNNVYQIPIFVEEGERITQVICRVFDADTNSISMKVMKADMTGTTTTTTQLGSTATSVGSTGNNETLTVGSLTETAGATAIHYFAHFTTTATTNIVFYGIDVTTDVP